jgi:hypothetical protein
MFDPFKQSKLMNGFNNLKSVQLPQSKIDSIDDLKKLAGVNENIDINMIPDINRGQIMREQNIKPGSDEWFKLWFAKPKLTGEKPF